ncbi:MAG: hypothetical protein IT285_03705 [Bdellovibrionales bacterium]|nr:hypothetical protein [Bdellovibrionales bacterium]
MTAQIQEIIALAAVGGVALYWSRRLFRAELALPLARLLLRLGRVKWAFALRAWVAVGRGRSKD